MVKVFFAGEGYGDIKTDTKCSVLVNYFYIKNSAHAKTIKQHYKYKELFLDSGAFTAWTKGVDIPIEEYCEFVKEADCDFYSVLDVIGDDKATFENQKKMEELGTTPVPCFHYGDDWKYLEHYCEKYDFISLGGMVGKSTKDLQPWLDKIFRDYPNQKFHGFGMTREKLMERYPWYSVDSSSWIKNGCSKRIFSYENGTIYLGNHPSVTDLILKNNKPWRDFFEKYNLKTVDLYKDYKEIMKANIYGFMEFEQIKPKNEAIKQQTLF